MERFQFFERLAESWQGPISAAVYGSDAELFQLMEFWKSSKLGKTRKNIGLHGVFKKGPFYPINYLRNVAINATRSEFIFLLDVDFLPSRGLEGALLSSTDEFAANSVLVVPAFEMNRTGTSELLDKEELLKEWDLGNVQRFRSDVWPQGHAPTNYSRWRESGAQYATSWAQDYEPYFMIRKSDCPLYDRRFVGFGWNKVAHAMQLNRLGFKFNVHPSGFILHQPHAPSFEIHKYRKQSIYRKCMQTLKGEFVRDLITGVL
ncbi:unnamed protein product, partial [Mesorhabditis spiculigera]